MPNHSVAALPPCQAPTAGCHSTVAAAVALAASQHLPVTDSITHTDSVTSGIRSRGHTHAALGWPAAPGLKYLFSCHFGECKQCALAILPPGLFFFLPRRTRLSRSMRNLSMQTKAALARALVFFLVHGLCRLLPDGSNVGAFMFFDNTWLGPAPTSSSPVCCKSLCFAVAYLVFW